MRNLTLILFIVILCSLNVQAQKRELKGNQSYWPRVELPVDQAGHVMYSGDIIAQVSAARLYQKAKEWIEINSNGPYNKPLSLDPQNLQVEFQRSFNYYFGDVSSIPDEDNKIFVYRVKLSFKDQQVSYTLDQFQHDHRGQLIAFNSYLQLLGKDQRLQDQIKSQLIMHVEGFVWKNGEEKGFLEDLTRVMNSIAIKK